MSSVIVSTKSKRRFSHLAMIGVSSFLLCLAAFHGLTLAKTPVTELLVYVGTYTTPPSESKGIYGFRLDLSSGKLAPLGLVGETISPGFLAVNPNGRFLYAVNEVGETDGKKGGTVSAFALDHGTGKLKLINRQPSKGANPCHLSVDRTGRTVLVANYGGSVATLPVQPDGSLGQAKTVLEHQGSSADASRQEGPHPHGIYLDSANRYSVVPDLGADRIFVYQFNSTRGNLAVNNPPSVSLQPGAGPRHFAFHPQAHFAYVINELSSTITAFSYDPVRGILSEIQTISTLPADFNGKNTTAEIMIHPSGKFLYGSNRGHDSIAVFQIDPVKGTLSPIQDQPTLGKTPRYFGIEPSGKYLVAANQDSNNLVVFNIDAQTGRLSSTGVVADAPKPACVVFVAGK
ncbi:MAG: lactonase family protein [Terriglobia bacterium]